MNKFVNTATAALTLVQITYSIADAVVVPNTTRIPPATDYAVFGTKRGAVTKVIPVLNTTKTLIDTPRTLGISPGFENTSTIIMDCATATGISDWIGVAPVCNVRTLTWTDYGTVIDCAGFLSTGATLPASTNIDNLICVGQ